MQAGNGSNNFPINSGIDPQSPLIYVIVPNSFIFHTGDYHADFSGYAIGEGPGQGLDKHTSVLGGSGAGHGGRGGRSKYGLYSSPAYGSMYEPREMGSGGGHGDGGDEGGRGAGNWCKSCVKKF